MLRQILSRPLPILLFLLFLFVSKSGQAVETQFIAVTPLSAPINQWSFNDYWQQKTIGNKDFYVFEHGPYYHLSKEAMEPLKQVGFLDRMSPGYLRLENFDPQKTSKLSPAMKEMVQSYLRNKWPLLSIEYCTFQGNPPPSREAIQAVGDLWMGDSMPEEALYRLEPVFNYLKDGSLFWAWNHKAALDFFKNRLMPRLDKEMPFYKDLKHQWTRPELRRLSDLYTEEYFRPISRPIAWTMFLSPYYIASNPAVVTVASKGADAFLHAYAKGVMRQSGGKKFYFVWRGHEPTEMYTHIDDSAWFAMREEWGYPLPHLWYYIFRPYLIGANAYANECFPPVEDFEGDKQYELPVTGLILKNLFDFVDRHPNRGVNYSSVGLLLDYNRAIPENGWGSYAGYNLPMDDADQMNNGLINSLIFPEHRHTRYTGGYSRTAPYGEIFDLLSPNLPGKPVDEKTLENYKVLFALGGLNADQDYAKKIIAHVRKGGTLVINAADVGTIFPPDFLGVTIHSETVSVQDSACALCGKKWVEQSFPCHVMKLQKGAEAIITGKEGLPLISRNPYGKGTVIVMGARYLIQEKAVETTEGWGGRRWQKKALLDFVPHFLDHLCNGINPVEIMRREEDREDLSWIISKKGEGWLVTVFNYSLLREPLVARPEGTAKVLAEYPYREVPFKIVCRMPVEDVMEWYQDRDVNWTMEGENAVISETIHGGEIRVYEIQPKKIEMAQRTRFVNYALNKPVTASSNYKGYPPTNAVDGNLDNEKFWWSGVEGRLFTMPQWLMVDLGEVKTIDHVLVQFHCWKHESLDTRLHVYKYLVEASVDGEKWQKVLDESKNEKNARLEGLERWFDPVPARYVRLTILRNSAHAGAQVVELKVLGSEKETYLPKRKSLVPPWEVRYPGSVTGLPPDKLLYLIDLKPAKEPTVGWLPAGTKWVQMNGPIKLMSGFSTQEGRFYPKAIFGEAPSEIIYALPPGCRTFVSAIGLGNISPKSSVIFKVFVDGVEKYKSSLYRCGDPVLPVVVDVSKAKELKLVVEDGGDGIIDDYSWWGEARLIRE